jgi:Transcription termination factor nusG
MADKHWYVLKVRPGFTAVVTQRLRRLNLEVFVPETGTIRSEQPHSQAAAYVYCLFDLQNRELVTTVPGVLDVMGICLPFNSLDAFVFKSSDYHSRGCLHVNYCC